MDTPTLYFVDTTTNRLYMELVEGITVKQFFYNNHSVTIKNEKGIFFKTFFFFSFLYISLVFLFFYIYFIFVFISFYVFYACIIRYIII